MIFIVEVYFRLQRSRMAKSLRSKWKRKMKAVKRVRYGEKVTKEKFLSRKDCFMMIGVLV